MRVCLACRGELTELTEGAECDSCGRWELEHRPTWFDEPDAPTAVGWIVARLLDSSILVWGAYVTDQGISVVLKVEPNDLQRKQLLDILAGKPGEKTEESGD